MTLIFSGVVFVNKSCQSEMKVQSFHPHQSLHRERIRTSHNWVLAPLMNTKDHKLFEKNVTSVVTDKIFDANICRVFMGIYIY